MSERDKPAAPQSPMGIAAGAARKRQKETAADRARIGTVIAGSYRIDEVIGRGAIGAVFGGIHLRLERPVAVKFVDPALVDEPEIRARFKREAKIAAQIGSSHAVEVFDYGLADDGAPYLVMERLVGEDLHARLTRDGPISVERALHIAKQVCRALGAAHGNGIVHRDLKPENVFLVDRDGEANFVKVVDFGLSTFVQSDDTRLTRAGQSVGTPLYMAPEQAGAHAFDARVDVYSLGVLIFEMTTCRLPFEAQTLQALLVALATQAPRSIRDHDPSLPEELDELVLRFIARDPRVRPKSAAAAYAEIVALEERLRERRRLSQAAFSPPPDRRYSVPSPDEVMGEDVADPFEAEVSGHLDELRRTGRLATSVIDFEEELEPGSPTTKRESAAKQRTSDDRVSRPSAPPRGRSSDAPATDSPRGTTTSRPTSRSKAEAAARKAERDSENQRKKPRTQDEIEEDSGVFYGRVVAGKNGRPEVQAIKSEPPPRATLSPNKKPPSVRPSLPPEPPGPPRAVLYIALLTFLVVAALVLLKAIRR
jgi:serine/threonine-protein kinase